MESSLALTAARAGWLAAGASEPAAAFFTFQSAASQPASRLVGRPFRCSHTTEQLFNLEPSSRLPAPPTCKPPPPPPPRKENTDWNSFVAVSQSVGSFVRSLARPDLSLSAARDAGTDRDMYRLAGWHNIPFISADSKVSHSLPFTWLVRSHSSVPTVGGLSFVSALAGRSINFPRATIAKLACAAADVAAAAAANSTRGGWLVNLASSSVELGSSPEVSERGQTFEWDQ